MMDSIKINFNLRRILIMLLIAFFLFAMCAYFLYQKEISGKEIYDGKYKFIVLYVGPPLFFLMMIQILYPIITGKPGFVIDRSGVIDYSGLWMGFGRIYWDEVAEIKIHKTSRGDKEVHFYLIDSDKVLSRYSKTRRMLLKGIHGFENGIVGIQIVKLDTTIEALWLAIEKYRK